METEILKQLNVINHIYAQLCNKQNELINQILSAPKSTDFPQIAISTTTPSPSFLSIEKSPFTPPPASPVVSRCSSVATDLSIDIRGGSDAGSESSCGKCQKMLKTKRTLAIHERNCKGKRRALDF
ncbi:unnamed protein product [Caenorhabditis angaria]|uniref:C2H2-type domain-containing protein n=1 Tax=Caenorhabditis angaria TaxID=860376 RepID=A0A9P1IPI1_9PELO|nr:unnamed protein product [Caenorhabditis angaria]